VVPVVGRRTVVGLLSFTIVAGGFLSGGPSGPTPAAAATATLTAYAPTGALNVTGIAPSDDGKLWFVANGSDSVGRISPSGAVTTLPLPSLHEPSGIVQGTDALIWVTSTTNDELLSINPATDEATGTSGTNPGDISAPTAITVGPDGALWWTNSDNHSIGRRDPDGTTTHFTDAGIVDPEGIAAGPGGLWFTSTANNMIGMITTSGTISLYTSADVVSPTSIALGPDGAMWFTNTTSIGRITTDGSATITKVTPAAITAPRQITAGPDGNLWVTNGTGNSLVRLTTSGAATAYTGAAFSNPVAVAFGGDNAIWFSAVNNGTKDSTIVRFSTGATVGAMRPFVVPGDPNAIVRGRDNALWVAGGTGRMTRVTTNGAVRSQDGFAFTPTSMANGTGSDHAAWGADPALDTAPGYDAAGTKVAVNTHHGTPTGIESLAIGPDAAAWFATEGAILRYNHIAGTTTPYASTSIKSPISMTVGSDKALWFVNQAGNSIGRITMAGVLKFYTNSQVNSPTAIVAGPDGALWFTSAGNNRIGRITTAGAFTFYTSSAALQPQQIAAGPDGALWFTLAGAARIGRITTAGTITTYAIPFLAGTSIRGRGIVAGTDGALWVTTQSPAVLLRVNAIHDTIAPVAKAPTAALVLKGVLTGSRIPVRVSWSATDTGLSGIGTYEVLVQTDGKAWSWVSRGLTSTSSVVSLVSGHSYRFRVRAIDKAGNVSAFAYGVTLKTAMTQDSSSAVKYSSGWHKKVASTAFSGGTTAYTTKNAASASIRFSGRAIAWVTSFGPTHGKVKIYVDGTYVKTVDTYAVGAANQVLAYTRTWSTVGTHTLKLVAVTTASRPRVDVDAFALLR
jgi:virginiamycin B lyase